MALFLGTCLVGRPGGNGPDLRKAAGGTLNFCGLSAERPCYLEEGTDAWKGEEQLCCCLDWSGLQDIGGRGSYITVCTKVQKLLLWAEHPTQYN